MIESILVSRAVCKNICLNILTAWGNGFLNVSMTLIEKTDGKNRKKERRLLDLMMKTVSDQPHIAKNVAYVLTSYGIVLILVRQGPFMD